MRSTIDPQNKIYLEKTIEKVKVLYKVWKIINILYIISIMMTMFFIIGYCYTNTFQMYKGFAISLLLQWFFFLINKLVEKYLTEKEV